MTKREKGYQGRCTAKGDSAVHQIMSNSLRRKKEEKEDVEFRAGRVRELAVSSRSKFKLP